MRWRWIALAAAWPAGAPAQDVPREAVEIRQLAELRGRLAESSGLAVSRRLPGIVWTHNDSGDGPFLYAVDTAGTLRATFEVSGARAVDWEDLAIGPCPTRAWQGRDCLFVGDIGDNAERRSRITIYAVPEPTFDPGGEADVGLTVEARPLWAYYAGGARDAEALAVHPDGRLSIVTKGRDGLILRFEIAADAWDGIEVGLRDPDTLRITPQLLAGRWVTGAAVSADGRTAVLRTYTEIYRFRVGARWELAGPPCWTGFAQPQSEAIDFLADGRLLLSSERAFGREATLLAVRCP